MSVDPWMEACPRRARMRPPGWPGARTVVRPAGTPGEGGASCTGRGPDHGPLIAPGRQVIPVTFHVKPGEDAVEVLGVGEVLGEDRGRVGVGDHVVTKVLLVR